eukprot:CAMPEP_0181304814 /NCGR_PEP_ID=MMETSP1101-20121128/9369_1 /TAXON_ID=46948 /ORGANISM="Rhodomonas abbreviata, Strain Caron Lab Isolate" /LENGTH=82 /DNA_ID=CAMNT_0023410633 /DNA_START=5281 /DNA_END=5529 /DNA_ORIENTATION=-
MTASTVGKLNFQPRTAPLTPDAVRSTQVRHLMPPNATSKGAILITAVILLSIQGISSNGSSLPKFSSRTTSLAAFKVISMSS